MHRFKSTLTALAVAAIVAAGAGAASSVDDPPWKRALEQRSEELNRSYGLGPRISTQARTPGWMHALEVRSDGLNRQHGLGKYAG